MTVVVGIVAIVGRNGIGTTAILIGRLESDEVGTAVAVRAVVVASEIACPAVEVVGKLLELVGVLPHVFATNLVLWVKVQARLQGHHAEECGHS